MLIICAVIKLKVAWCGVSINQIPWIIPETALARFQLFACCVHLFVHHHQQVTVYPVPIIKKILNSNKSLKDFVPIYI